MKLSIKKINGEVVFSGDFESMQQCVEAAVQSGKSLESANLRSANLCYANLRYANLRYANLCSANLLSANLRSANLCSANLLSANLRSANLCYANLRYANLRSANLCYANLRYANLRYANLCYADLRYAENSALAIAMTRILPEGDLIGWKKCKDDVVAQLLIPAKARRSHAFGRKCRAERVKVLKLFGGKVGLSLKDGKTKYAKGTTVKCDKWCDDFTQECAGGIHFFITREEAEAFTL